MSYTKYHTDASVDSNKAEFEENKMLLWLENFWQFSLFYGNHLASLHGRKKH